MEGLRRKKLKLAGLQPVPGHAQVPCITLSALAQQALQLQQLDTTCQLVQ